MDKINKFFDSDLPGVLLIMGGPLLAVMFVAPDARTGVTAVGVACTIPFIAAIVFRTVLAIVGSEDR
ncbi:MAG: hypothetical protein EBR82_00150 [Caulobacteraceae bacterium]|nr:hypothetical protein [Caulobacteraceae bacterium]